MQHAMQFNSLQPRNPGRHFAGLTVVVLLHAGILLAALYGLHRSGARIAAPADLEWVRIVAPPPPPPDTHRPDAPKLVLQSMPKTVAPPVMPIILSEPDNDAYSPRQPDTAPGLSGPVAAATDSPAPSATLGIACPNAQSLRASMRYPVQARRDGLQGDVLARFVVDAGGKIRDIQIVSSSQRAFNGAVIDAVRQFGCVGQGQDVTVEVPFSFRLE